MIIDQHKLKPLITAFQDISNQILEEQACNEQKQNEFNINMKTLLDDLKDQLLKEYINKQ